MIGSPARRSHWRKFGVIWVIWGWMWFGVRIRETRFLGAAGCEADRRTDFKQPQTVQIRSVNAKRTLPLTIANSQISRFLTLHAQSSVSLSAQNGHANSRFEENLIRLRSALNRACASLNAPCARSHPQAIIPAPCFDPEMAITGEGGPRPAFSRYSLILLERRRCLPA